jgi:hypothetical protein
MLLPAIRVALTRELRAFRRTIEAYPDDAGPWAAIPGVPNCGGTLALHVAGNIQHFVGALLGGSAYVRDREAEFARRGLSRAELLRELDAAADAVALTFATLDEVATGLPFPATIAGHQFRTSEVLVHLAVHLAFHLGQADTHRRAVTGLGQSVDPVSAKEMHELLIGG